MLCSEVNPTVNLSNCGDAEACYRINISVLQRYSLSEFRREFLPFPFALQRWIAPLWIVLGTLGNALSFLVWVTPKVRRENSSAIYLAAMSLSDLFLQLLLVKHYLAQNWEVKVLERPFLCQTFQAVFIFAQYYAVPLVFAFTFERWIAICYPFRRDTLCTPRRACIVCMAVGGIVLVFAVIQFFAWSYYDASELCDLRESWSGLSGTVYFAFVESLMSALLPICTLVFNILVIRELRRITSAGPRRPKHHSLIIQQHRRNCRTSQRQAALSRSGDSQLQTSVSRNGDSQRQARNGDSQAKPIGGEESLAVPNPRERSESSSFRSTTVMLLTVSFYLILCTLPVGVLYFCQFFYLLGDQCLIDSQIRVDPKWTRFIAFQTVKEIIDQFSISHYSLNFIIYLATGKAFRKQSLRLLGCARFFQKEGGGEEYYTMPRQARSSAGNGMLASFRQGSRRCTEEDNKERNTAKQQL